VNELREWAKDRPLFTLNDAERAFDIERASLRQKLSRQAQRNEIHRIERGKYTVHDDPMVYATYIEIPSYLTLWSALRYYDLTPQQPTRVQVIAASNRDDLPGIEFHQSARLFGFGQHRYDGFDIFVADAERLLLDCLAHPTVSVADLGELLEAISPARAAAYADRYGQTAMKKRVGYLLEQVHDVSLDDLRVEDRNYPLLDVAGPADGDPNSRWRLTVNGHVSAG